MNKKIISILSIFTFLSINYFSAQSEFSNKRDGESVEYCSQHKKMKELRQNPAFLQQFIEEQDALRLIENQLSQETNPQRVVYKIPIVFHVLHNGGIENITNAQIYDALEVLNRDFRKLNSDTASVVNEFRSIIADVEVEFVMATKAPNGECFNGITRTQSAQSYSDNGDAQVNAIISGNDVYNGTWPGNRYLNIFICGEIGGAAGYTFTPSNWIGSGMDNGIWILHDYVGRIGTGGVGTDRALTHEVGHWLNLEHTWGPNNSPGDPSSCSTDDGISDTPNTIGVTACLLNENSCGPRANVENYMDYSYCSKMYTQGQRTRMRAALNSSTGGRSNLWQAANLVLTGADGNTYLCAADFYSDRTVVCPGSTVSFFDNSYNNVISWNWSFPGAVSTTSNSQNPSVVYNTPGVYEVVLIAGDGNTTLTKTKTAYITVLESGASLPILDGFETYSSIASSGEWETYNPQNNGTFQISSTVGLSSSKSAMIPNFSQTGTANLDELISNAVDLSGITATTEITLSFRYAYRKKTTANSEKLYVLMTGNCGESWEIRKSIQGSSLSPLTSTSNWAPSSAADWTTVHVTNISSTYWNENFRFKFRFEGSGGNNLYLDNINIYNAGPSETLIGSEVNLIKENTNTGNLNLFPNPIDKEFSVEYFSQNQGQTDISIVDLLGKIVDQKTILSAAGNNLVVIGTEQLTPGIYNVNITIEGANYIKQVVVK